MRFIHSLLLAEYVGFGERVQNIIRQNREQLIGVVFHQEGHTALFEGLPEPVRQTVGVGGDLKVQIIRHKGVKLDAQQAAFCQHGAVLFDEVTEVLRKF